MPSLHKGLPTFAGGFFLYAGTDGEGIAAFAFPGNDVDDTGQGIGAIDDAHGAIYDLNAFDGIDVDLTKALFGSIPVDEGTRHRAALFTRWPPRPMIFVSLSPRV